MTIEEKDFRLISIDDSSIKYDLELLYKIQPKGKEPRWEFKNVAYGISLDHALQKIIQYRISNKQNVFSLKEYLEEFKKETTIIKNILRYEK